MEDDEIAARLTAAQVRVTARSMALYRQLQAMGERLRTLEEIYALLLPLDSEANFVGVARIVRSMWLGGLLQRELTREKSGRIKAVFRLVLEAGQPAQDDGPCTPYLVPFQVPSPD